MLEYIVVLLIIIIIGLVIYIARSQRKYEYIIDSMIQEENNSDVDTTAASNDNTTSNVNVISNAISNAVVDYVNQSEIEATTNANTDATSNTIVDYVNQSSLSSSSDSNKIINDKKMFIMINEKINMIHLTINIYVQDIERNTLFEYYYKTTNPYGNQCRYVPVTEEEYTQFKKILENSKEYLNREPGYMFIEDSVNYKLPEKFSTDEVEITKPFEKGGLIYDTFMICMKTNVISLIEFGVNISVPTTHLIAIDRGRELNIHFDKLLGVIREGVTDLIYNTKMI